MPNKDLNKTTGEENLTSLDLSNILPQIEEAKQYIRGYYGLEPGYKDNEIAFMYGFQWTIDQIKKKLLENKL